MTMNKIYMLQDIGSIRKFNFKYEIKIIGIDNFPLENCHL